MRRQIESAEVDLVLGPLEERLSGPALASRAVDDPTAAGESQLGTVDVPHGLAVHLHHVGDPVGELGGGALGPEVVGLGQVGVGVDHPQPLKCQRHGPSRAQSFHFILDVDVDFTVRPVLRPGATRGWGRCAAQRVRGNPRSISLVEGSGQRVVTTLGRV